MLRVIIGPVIAVFALAAMPAVAADDEVDAETLAAVTAVATKGYAHPEAATVRAVHKSLATSGTGYCGEVSIEDSTEFTTFHVILEASTGQSVLRLSDFPNPESSQQAKTVHELMRNFGCLR
jgi:hypothetical protein